MIQFYLTSLFIYLCFVYDMKQQNRKNLPSFFSAQRIESDSTKVILPLSLFLCTQPLSSGGRSPKCLPWLIKYPFSWVMCHIFDPKYCISSSVSPWIQTCLPDFSISSETRYHLSIKVSWKTRMKIHSGVVGAILGEIDGEAQTPDWIENTWARH